MKKLKVSAFLLMGFLILGCGNAQISTEDEKDSDSTIAKKKEFKAVVKLEWNFDQVKESEYGEPFTNVVLLVDGKSFTIAKENMGTFSVADKVFWPDMKVPENALTACSGWWAGAGDYYYVVLKNGTLVVMHAPVDEGMDIDKDLKYEMIKEIKP